MQAFLRTLVASLALHRVSGARVSSNASWWFGNATDEAKYCCCKEKKCEVDAKADDDVRDAVYSPQENLCCKFKRKACGSMFAFSGYKKEAPSMEYCVVAKDDTFKAPMLGQPVHEVVRAEDLVPGTNEHTMHTYCEFSPDVDAEDKVSEDHTKTESLKTKLVQTMVDELSGNSIDAMAKDIFSLYLCVRWAPSPDFVRAGDSEISTGHLDNTSTVLEHYSKHRFTPLRCTRNVQVYGGDDKPTLGQTNFDVFEKEMQALSNWYGEEAGSTLTKRLEKVQESEGQELNSSVAAFDLDAVKKIVAKCPDDAKILVNVQTATTEELLADCGAARWWLRKLQDWHQAMPFTSFMMPDAVAAQEAHPEKGDQVLVCFGKRVASQLHRRDGGDHLITDQSMIGCHGFWDLPMAAKMLDRIVHLWRPPTCQLAAMELEMKMKIMDLIANMNTQFFDALPALLVDEMSPIADADGKALKAAHGANIMKGVWNSIVTSFSGMSGKYQKLGQLLGNTVTKWVVCPMKPISDSKKLEQLDMALGTEDLLASYYAKSAYSKWTGAKGLLPGEECTRDDADRKLKGLPNNAKVCNLGVMQEDMPEPYHGTKFMCPVQPLLPGKQQLDVFKKKHNHCVMRMNGGQMAEQSWYYRGRTPHLQQYNVTENLPSQRYGHVKILDVAYRPDTDFAIWRHFATVGHHCTTEEFTLTPRWCKVPDVANPPKGFVSNLLTGGATLTGAVVGGAVKAGLEATGVVEKTPSNTARTERLGNWLYGKAKGFEKWMKSAGEWVGRASTRYQRLHKRSFEEVEVNELIHSASFQAENDNTGGDSKGRGKFDRYAVVADCLDFDPSREFRLKYTWSEKAISLARKAQQKYGEAGLMTGSAFFVQLRGSGVLTMRSERSAWISSSAHVRAGRVGVDAPSWSKTKNPYLQEMSGVLSADASAVAVSDLIGFQATFACGTRLEMHDLPLRLTSPPKPDGNFSKCVLEGKAKNEELRASHPGERRVMEETVIRVTFAALDDCYREVVGSIANANETKNPVFAGFMSIDGCKTRVPASEVPEDIKGKQSNSKYRGLYLGKGLPTETLLEVLIEPEDFLMEVDL